MVWKGKDGEMGLVIITVHVAVVCRALVIDPAGD